MNQISYDDFAKIEIRIGKIIKAEIFPKARTPAYKLWIDFGDLGIKTSSAQITQLYQIEGLIGKLVTAVTNFPARQIANFFSEVLVLGVENSAGAVVLLQPEREVNLGQRIF